MLFITRYFYLLLALAALLVLPYAAQKLIHSLEAQRKAETLLEESQKLRSAKDLYQSKVTSINRFRTRVDAFMKTAKQTHSRSESWIPYQVNVVDQPMELTNFQGVLEHARHGYTPQGTSFYFSPERFLLKYLTQKDIENSSNKDYQLNDIVDGKTNLSVTLKGTFYVFQRQ
ncbi:MAG: hypothetical protein HQL53_05360 [Magnetococcales bacterium]|nr:hypothetical protein [Magnetococcales bacterium]